MLVVLLKKTDYNTKITEIEKKLISHNHDKYTTTPEFNTLAAAVFNARLAEANLMPNCQVKIVENEMKILIQATLLVKVILKKMVHKIISYFSH